MRRVGVLNSPLVGCYFCLAEAAKVSEVARSIHARPGVVKFAIGEERVMGIDGMADGAIAPLRILEDGEAVDRSRRERLFVAAVLILIKGRVAAEQRAFEARQGLLNL